MLIEECRDLTGMSYPEIDEALHLPSEQAYRWSRFGGPIGSSGNKKERSPQAGSMKSLELRVAKLLGRPAHKLTVENNSDIELADLLKDLDVCELAAGVNLRGHEQGDLQIGYEDDWPTYRRLKYTQGRDLISVYRWQWKVMWDSEIRKKWGDEKVEETIQELFQKAKQERAFMKKAAP